MFLSNKCRHKFEPRYTSGLTDSEVLSRMASILLSSDCSEVVWKQFIYVIFVVNVGLEQKEGIPLNQQVDNDVVSRILEKRE